MTLYPGSWFCQSHLDQLCSVNRAEKKIYEHFGNIYKVHNLKNAINLDLKFDNPLHAIVHYVAGPAQFLLAASITF